MGNLTITFYDVVSYLFPGVLLLLFLNKNFSTGIDVADEKGIFITVILGYVLGALIHLVGLLLFWGFYIDDKRKDSIDYKLIKFLDSIVSVLPLKVKRLKYSRDEFSKTVKEKLGIDLTDNRLGLFILADALTSKPGTSDKDTLLAKEGLYRSLTSLLVILLTISLLTMRDNILPVFIVAIILIEFCRYGREYYRELKNQRVYTLSTLSLKNYDEF
ncbi:MAG: hypothetical protein WCW56_03035 [Candidatus Paceibacterota bacterium]|jgi:hypothetical protein